MKKYLFVFLLIFTGINCYAQSNAYLIPRRIYTGDPAILVVPLSGITADTYTSQNESGDIVLTPSSQNFPYDPNIDFHRITLERHINGSRLMIEFTPFITGVVELPQIEIGGNIFSGLSVTVNSIIEDDASYVLSEPASSLAMPGTALMLYGGMALIVFLILFALWFLLKGGAFLRKWREKFRRRRFFASMKNLDKNLQKAALKGVDKRLILDELSRQFRVFLSYIANVNCLVMTAGEFNTLSFNLPELKGRETFFLENFFRFCDELRFSGAAVDEKDVFTLLGDLRFFVCALENAEKTAASGGTE